MAGAEYAANIERLSARSALGHGLRHTQCNLRDAQWLTERMSKNRKRKGLRGKDHEPTKSINPPPPPQPSDIARTESPPTENPKSLKSRRAFSDVAKGLGVFLAIAGIALAVYAIRPVLTASPQLPKIPSMPLNGRFLVTNTGLTPIRNVQVECRGNKVVFSEGHTFTLNGYVIMHEYEVPSVSSGESFVVSCPQEWHLYTTENHGVFYFGEMRRDMPPLVIDFSIDKSGRPTLTHPKTAMKGFYDFAGYTDHPPTGIDASLIIRYEIPFFPGSYTKTIHAIAENTGGALSWRTAPFREPTIPDGRGTIRVTSSGNKVTSGPRK